MEERITLIIENLLDEQITKEQAINSLALLVSPDVKQFYKNKLDLLNWAKSELKSESNSKIGKTMTPYRSDKLIFLRVVVDKLKGVN